MIDGMMNHLNWYVLANVETEYKYKNCGANYSNKNVLTFKNERNNNIFLSFMVCVKN